MEILRALGVDWTLFVHLVCFGVSYFFLSTFILKPYMRAMHERESRTIGNEEQAVRLIEEAGQLNDQYESKARGINSEIRSYYDQSRTEAMKHYDELVAKSRDRAAETIKSAQNEISEEVQKARQKLSAEIPSVSSAIASKLVGKEISL